MASHITLPAEQELCSKVYGQTLQSCQSSSKPYLDPYD